MKMDVTVVLLVFLLQGSGALVATEQEGNDLQIKCVHSNAASNVKYFCRGGCGGQDVLVTSDTPRPDRKYHIRDEGNTFYVTVSTLTAADAGLYWCGVRRLGADTYSQVTIRVSQRTADQRGASPSSSNTLTPEALLGVGAGLGAVLLALASLLLVLRHRKRLTCSSPEKDGAARHESKQEVGRHRDVAAASASRKQETRDAADHIYSNVSSPPQDRPEVLVYCSVSFSRPAACGATYTPIKPAEEPTVYASV